MNEKLAEQIKSLAADVGYAACGIAGVEPFDEYAEALDDIIGSFPEAADLYDWMRKRVDPLETAPWARSLVVCVRNYGKYKLPEEPLGHIGKNYLCDRRYRECPDHGMPKAMLKGLRDLGMKAKWARVSNRLAGARAGVTRFGRNTFAYSEDHGSWINLENWVVDAELPHDEPNTEPACPEGCRKCIDACPTGAITAPFRMRMDRCIAWLTYEAPEPIEDELWQKMGGWVYGCDVCQDVCPLNKGKWQEKEGLPWIEPVAHLLTPEVLAEIDQETYEKLVQPLFWYIGKDEIARWHANARRALG